MANIEFGNFEDAQVMALLHPESFSAPTQEELISMKEGDYVKVCHSSERFWTKVIKVDGNKVIASVENQLISAPFELHEEIEFEKNNVYSFYREAL